MLSNRLTTLIAFLKQQSSASPPSQPPDAQDHSPPIDHQLLRSIQALTSRIPLLHPADHESSHSAAHAEKSDVALVSLLASLGQNLKDAKTLGGKFHVVENAKTSARKSYGGMMGMGRVQGGGPFGMGSMGEGMGDDKDELYMGFR
jgi:COP9 signalosome complex subunit 6